MLGVGATMEKEQPEHEQHTTKLTSTLEASTVRVVGFQIEEEED